eukprot:scaffold122468_cov63-Phaeocystis_antarctica.AAC.2
MWGPRSGVGRPVVSVCVLCVNAPNFSLYIPLVRWNLPPADRRFSVCLSVFQTTGRGRNVILTRASGVVFLLSHPTAFLWADLAQVLNGARVTCPTIDRAACGRTTKPGRPRRRGWPCGGSPTTLPPLRPPRP